MTSTILAKAIAKAGDSRRPLVLAEVVNEPWDAAYVFGPYTQAKDIDAALGFSWESSVKGALSGDEGNHLLVFTSAGRVASHVALRRAHGEFCKSSLSRRIDRAAATFIVERGQWRYEVCLSGLPVVSDLSRPVTRL
jgi:hypothetical protein